MIKTYDGKISKSFQSATDMQPTGSELRFEQYTQHDLARLRTVEGDAHHEKRFVTTAVVTDTHIPDERQEAILLASFVLQTYRETAGRPIDLLITGSDVFSFDGKGKFDDKRPEYMKAWDRDLARFLHAHKEYLAELRTHAPNVPALYLPANHDVRIRNLLYANVPDMAGYTYAHWIQDLRDQNVLYLTQWLDRHAFWHMNAKLTLTHGHIKQGRASTISSVLTNMLAMWDFRRTVIFGHYHQTHTITRSSLFDGTVVEAHAVGCLGNLTPSYGGVTKWNNGMALVHYEVGDRATGGFVENLIFEESKGYLQTWFRGNLLRVKLSKKPSRKLTNSFS